jgi:hypothetical protein
MTVAKPIMVFILSPIPRPPCASLVPADIKLWSMRSGMIPSILELPRSLPINESAQHLNEDRPWQGPRRSKKQTRGPSRVWPHKTISAKIVWRFVLRASRGQHGPLCRKAGFGNLYQAWECKATMETQTCQKERRRPRKLHAMTIGDLRRQGKMLEVVCTQCWHVLFLSPARLTLHGNILASDAHHRLRCAKCGAKAGYSRAQTSLEH